MGNIFSIMGPPRVEDIMPYNEEVEDIMPGDEEVEDIMPGDEEVEDSMLCDEESLSEETTTAPALNDSGFETTCGPDTENIEDGETWANFLGALRAGARAPEVDDPLQERQLCSALDGLLLRTLSNSDGTSQLLPTATDSSTLADFFRQSDDVGDCGGNGLNRSPLTPLPGRLSVQDGSNNRETTWIPFQDGLDGDGDGGINDSNDDGDRKEKKKRKKRNRKKKDKASSDQENQHTKDDDERDGEPKEELGEEICIDDTKENDDTSFMDEFGTNPVQSKKKKKKRKKRAKKAADENTPDKPGEQTGQELRHSAPLVENIWLSSTPKRDTGNGGSNSASAHRSQKMDAKTKLESEKDFMETCVRCNSRNANCIECPRCKLARYCGTGCQKKDAKRHKESCLRIFAFNAAKIKCEEFLRRPENLFLNQYRLFPISFFLGSVPDYSRYKALGSRVFVLLEILEAGLATNFTHWVLTVRDVANKTAKILINTRENTWPLKLPINKRVAANMQAGNFILLLNAKWTVGGLPDDCCIFVDHPNFCQFFPGMNSYKRKEIYDWRGYLGC